MGLLEITEAFIGVNLWTTIFAWINLFILYLFLKRLLFLPIKNMIDSRQREIDDMYSDAENARLSAEELRTQYEERISLANEESEQMLKNALRRAQLKEEQILKEAGEQATRTLKRAEEQIELEKRRAINEVKNEASAIAIGIASAVIERDVSADEHRRLIDDFINKIGNE